MAAAASTSVQPTIQRAVVDVPSGRTEILQLKATAAAPCFNVCFIPGNPGASSFYIPFLRALHEACDGAAHVHSITYLGFDSDGLTPKGRVYNLAEQVQHKVDVVRHLMEDAKGVPVVLVGHSIGSYIACELSQRLDLDERALHTVALFPFFTVNPTCQQQRRLKTLTNFYVAIGWLASLLQWLPQQPKRLLIRLFAGKASTGMDNHAEVAAANLLHPTTVRNGFFLGGTEFQALAAPPDWAGIAALGPRFTAFCAPNDVWMPREQYNDLLATVPAVEAYWVEDMAHAFCTSTAQSVKMGNQVAAAVLRSRPGGT